MSSEHSEHSGPHRIVRASAGTGKTHRLSTRYVELLRSGASVESILASTFTRKAAGEILGRVLSRLAEASLDRVAARDLAQELGGRAFGPKAASRLLRSLCDELHRTSISTLDAFFFRVAAMLRFELGLRSKPRMSSIDDPLERARRQDALEDTLDRLADSGLSELLDLLQRLHRDSARSSISFALDGLLKDLYETFAQAPGIDAWSRLEVPTAPDSDRVRSAVDLLSRAVGGTAQAGLRKALAGNVEDAERGAWSRLLERGLAAKVAAGESSYRAKPIPDAWVEALEVLVGRARHEVLERVAEQTRATWEILDAFDRSYAQSRRRDSVLLFSDLPRELRRCLEAGDDDLLSELYFRLDGRVGHLLLDEFQDTSLDQWSILRPIAEEIRSYGDESRSFFCVGDSKQAIYGWRGGCADLFLRLHEDLALPVSSEEHLTGSYRTAQPVLEAVNLVFSSIERAPCLTEHVEAVRRWCEGFEQHEARRPHGGRVELCEIAGEDDDHELSCARRVARLHDRWPMRSVGVLVQTNEAASGILEALKREGVEASGEGGQRIHDDPAISFILAALRLADHPNDRVAAYHVSASPLGAVLGPVSLEAGEVARVSRELRESWFELGPARLLASWAGQLRDVCDLRGRRRLRQAIELAERWRDSGEDRPSALARYLEEARIEDPIAAGVRVMTIHKSKGLEFDAVVLPDLDRALLRYQGSPVLVDRESPLDPVLAIHRSAAKKVRALSPQLERAFHREQERRLRDDLSALYVAMTRASIALYLWPRPMEEGGRRGSSLSFASILRETLAFADARAPLRVGSGSLYENGDPSALDRPKVDGAAKLQQNRLDLVPSETTVADRSGRSEPRLVRLEEWLGGQRERSAGFLLGRPEEAAREAFLDWFDGLADGGRLHPVESPGEDGLAAMLLSDDGFRRFAGLERNTGPSAARVFRGLPVILSADGVVIVGELPRVAIPAGESGHIRVLEASDETGDASDTHHRLEERAHRVRDIVSRATSTPHVHIHVLVIAPAARSFILLEE